MNEQAIVWNTAMPSQGFDDEQKLDEYLLAISQKIVASRDQTWGGLSPAERATIAAHFLDLEIQNGGFELFFVNPGGDRWRETRAALSMIGAARIGAMFDEALSVFPDVAPSTDQMTRCRQYEQAGEGAERTMFRLTGEYYGLPGPEQLYSILIRFALQQSTGG